MQTDDRFTAPKDAALYGLISMEILEKIRRGLPRFVDGYPHVSSGLVYSPEPNTLWTSAFFPGMAYLAYDLTGDSAFLANADRYLDSFTQRLATGQGITHDLGFLYTLSCRAYAMLTGNGRAGALEKQAVALLAQRYNEKGGYIQAWGPMGIAYPDVKIIIDTMMNLCLLYNAEDAKYHEMACRHARTSAHTLMRPDGSSYHIYLMDPETGEAVSGHTHQGFRDESTWARGQGWAVYGFALSYRHTKDPEFLQIARNAAEVFIRNLPEDFVPYWDFSFTDAVPDVRDTSAAAIFICGLLELCNWVEEAEAERYRRIAQTVLRSLYDRYFLHGPDRLGILAEGIYHRNMGARECVIWGDYFFFEALVRMQKDWHSIW